MFCSGGSGFFEKALLRQWYSVRGRTNKPAQLTILIRHPENFNLSNSGLCSFDNFYFIYGDIRNPNSLSANSQFDGIIHVARDSNKEAALSRLERYDEIVEDTRHILI